MQRHEDREALRGHSIPLLLMSARTSVWTSSSFVGIGSTQLG